MAREETSRSRRRRSTKRGRIWVGQKVYTCPRAEAEQHEQELDGSEWSFNSAYPAMKFVGVAVDPYDPVIEGNARITAYYESAFNIFEFPVGRATISVYGRGEAVKLTKGLGTGDEAGPIETKPTPNADGDDEWWEPVEPGSYIAVDHKTIVVVKTAYRQSDLHWDTIGNRIGWVCNHDMPKMAGAKANTMKLIDAGIPKYVLSNPDDEIVPIEFIFERYPYGNEWPEMIWVQKWKKEVKQLPVIWPGELSHAETTADEAYVAEDGKGDTGAGWTVHKADAKTREVILTKKVGEAEERRVNRRTSFSDIKALLAWRI